MADVLDQTVDEALVLFKNHPTIRRALETLADVGLGYIALGQSSPTLSGGEAQRVKLSRELSKRSTGRTLYILDEPTTGLHFDDIKKLLRVLDRLVEGGNTVVVIEHNLDVIKTADWVIDMGPEGGDAGGCIVAEGTPGRWQPCRRATGLPFSWSGRLASTRARWRSAYRTAAAGSLSTSAAGRYFRLLVPERVTSSVHTPCSPRPLNVPAKAAAWGDASRRHSVIQHMPAPPRGVLRHLGATK